jgi:ABC-2 type transport system ATP-binding protein
MSPLVSVNGVAKKFDGKRVLSGVTFSAGRGEALGVIGPNGAGKTTLLRIVVGLLHVDSGNVRVDGEPVATALRRVRAAYFAGESTLPPAVRVRAWRHLFHDADEIGENRQFRFLSRGTRQLTGLRTVFSVTGLRLMSSTSHGTDSILTRRAG